MHNIDVGGDGQQTSAAVCRGIRVAVQHSEPILRAARRIESGDIGELLGRGLDSGGWGAVKRGIYRRHDSCLLATSHPTASWASADGTVRDAVSILPSECRGVYALSVVVNGVGPAEPSARSRARDSDRRVNWPAWKFSIGAAMATAKPFYSFRGVGCDSLRSIADSPPLRIERRGSQ